MTHAANFLLISILLALSFPHTEAADPPNKKDGPWTGFATSLTLHASFDQDPDAQFAAGDTTLYWAPNMKDRHTTAKPGLPPSDITLVPGGDDFGQALRFHRKTPKLVFFRALKNMDYKTEDWSGTVSFWLKLDPADQLETGFCDPIQITSKAWNNAAFFVEFEKRNGPVPFRLGVYADYEVWNPADTKWADIPFSDKPLLEVSDPPFSADRWTHVVFTFHNFNTGQPNGVAKLFLNGTLQGAIQNREQTFHWDPKQALIMLGLNYVGLLDELAIFNRSLTSDEVQALYRHPKP